MTCANKASSAAYTSPNPIGVSWNRPAFVNVIVAIVEAFREALQLRRAAHRAHPLDDQ
jgi:hypothetical protein